MLQARMPEQESEGFAKAPAHIPVLSSATYLTSLCFWLIPSYLESRDHYAVLPRQTDVGRIGCRAFPAPLFPSVALYKEVKKYLLVLLSVSFLTTSTSPGLSKASPLSDAGTSLLTLTFYFLLGGGRGWCGAGSRCHCHAKLFF